MQYCPVSDCIQIFAALSCIAFVFVVCNKFQKPLYSAPDSSIPLETLGLLRDRRPPRPSQFLRSPSEFLYRPSRSLTGSLSSLKGPPSHQLSCRLSFPGFLLALPGFLHPESNTIRLNDVYV